MRNFGNKLINTVCHIILDGQAHQKFYIAAHFIMVFQTMAAVAHPDSDFFKLVKWFDPSMYLAPSFTIIISSIIILLFASILIFKIVITQADDMLSRPSTLKVYLGNALLHLQMMCKTIVLGPVLRSSLLEILNPEGSGILSIGIIGLIIFSTTLLPISLYNTSNTFVLTPQLNKKLYYINIYFILNIFRIILSIVSVVSKSLMGPICAVFFVIFMIFSIKQPVFAYSHEQLLRGMISSIAFVCLCRVITQISGLIDPVSVQIAGILGFIPLIGWISDIRLNSILSLKQPTIHQIKILLFMLGNMQDYLDRLQCYILRHHKQCQITQCKCSAVVNQLVNKTQKSQDQKIWYDFMMKMMSYYYNLQQIVRLPSSQLKQKIQKYQQIVVDLAQINMFKLGRLNEAYYLLKNFQLQIQSRGMNFLSFKQKRKIVIYYLQQSIIARYKTDGVANLYADNYMNFQIQYQKYRALLLKTASLTATLWEQMNKREPHAPTLYKYLANLQKLNATIRQNYLAITANYEDSKNILEGITNDYFLQILNTPQKSPFHVIEPPRFQNLFQKRQDKMQRISQNMQAFSLNSNTPMSFVSVDQGTFGDIKGCNVSFSSTMNLQFGRKANIDQFMVPELRQIHHQKMINFLRNGNFSYQHTMGYCLTAKGKILHSKILIQIFPTISDGLTYIFFLKKMSKNKKIFAFKNGTIPYISSTFEQLFESRFSKQQLIQGIKDQKVKQARQKKICKIIVQNNELHLKFLHELSQNQGGYIYFQILDQEDMLQQAKTSVLGDRTTTRYFQNSSTGFGSGMKRNDDQTQSQMQKSDLMQKSLAENVKIVLKGVKNSFTIINDPKKQRVIFKVIIFNVIFVLLLGLMLTLCIINSQSNKQTYQNNFNINIYYNNFIMIVSRAVSEVKNVNYYAFTNQTTLATSSFNIFKTYNLINPTMDTLVSSFDVPSITQTWTTFSVKTDATLTKANITNFLAVSDFIQNQITNMASLTSASFNFPLALQMITKPLSSTATIFYQLVINTIYQQLPNFRLLKRNKMNTILYDSINTVLKDSFLLVGVALIAILYIVGMVFINTRVTRLKDFSYKYFETLGSDFIKSKQQRCKQFVIKYTDFNAENKLFQDTNAKSMHLDSKTTKQHNNISQEHTDREINLKQESKLFQSKNFDIQLQDSQGKMKSSLKQKINQKVFEESSYFLLVFKYLLPAVPFIIFAIAIGSIQATNLQQIKSILEFQQNIQTMQQNLHLIQLYAQQNGIYRPQMEQYISVQKTLKSLIFQMYSIQRSLVANSFDTSSVPKTNNFKNMVSYGNLCQMSSQFISSFNFTNMYNKTYCSTISDSMLTKGFYSSIIGYLQSVNTLILSNPNTTSYSSAQKVTYFSNDFFSDTIKIINFLDVTIDTFIYNLKIDFNNFVSNSANMTTIASFTAIGLLFLLIILLHKYYINSLRQQIIQITSLFSLISYQSVLKDQQLKTKFSQKIEDFINLE